MSLCAWQAQPEVLQRDALCLRLATLSGLSHGPLFYDFPFCVRVCVRKNDVGMSGFRVPEFVDPGPHQFA